MVKKKQASIKVLVYILYTVVTNYKNKKVPEVQVVMDMDGFGTKF
jgi:hypothetical protein